MAKDKGQTENTQTSVSVEQLQAENETLKARILELEAKEKSATETLAEKTTLLNENEVLKARVTELETLNNDLKVDNDKLKGTRDLLEVKISELSESKDDSNNRTENEDGEVKIRILLSPAGKFLLPYNVGQVVSLNANQADELVDCKYAEYVK